ncbi:MAG: type I-E CRISPR-associated protein Cse1/CasA [Bacillota bacterium]
MTRYSLWEEPWIPVLSQAGEPSNFSIRSVLVQAHTLREVFDPSPLVTVAIHRLLLAFLYRVFRPRSVADWVGLWRTGRLDPDRLDGYGAAWADRFDLLDPTRPFYQVPRMADEKVHPISALVLEAASGNNPTLFDHGKVEGMEALPLDRAACHLLAHQLFAVGGGVSKPFNRMDGPLTKGLVVEARGRILFETLLLNLVPLDHWTSLVPDSGLDCPFWETETPPDPVREGSSPLGPIDYLTWQSRQIHLCVDEASQMVTGCQVRQRYCLPKDGRRIDPAKAYRRKEQEGWVPFKVDKQRAIWQFTHVLLQATNTDLARPYLTDWLATVDETGQREGLDVPEVIGMNVSGLTTHPERAAKIELWRREQLPVPTAILERPELVGDLEDLMRQAIRVESLLQRSGEALVWALSKRETFPLALTYLRTGKVSDVEVLKGIRILSRSLGMVTRYWPALEAPFRQALEELPYTEFAVVQENWRGAIRSVALQAFCGVRDNLLHAEAPFEILTRIEHAFRSRLVGIFAENMKEGSMDDEESDE